MTILVTGCSRSGNTLMANLIATGFGVPHDPDEGYPEYGHVRKWPHAAPRVPELLGRNPDLRVVWMVRDPRAVIVSRHPDALGYWVPPQQWLACEEARLHWAPEPRLCVVRFEDLLREPAPTQTRLAAWLDLPVQVPFMDAVPQFVDDEHNRRVMGRHARLNTARLQPWLADAHDALYVSCVLHAYQPWIQDVARRAGYDL